MCAAINSMRHVKVFVSLFFIVVFGFFVIDLGTSQSSRLPVSNIDWEQDGNGFIRYSTNDSQKNNSAWWQFADNTSIVDNNIYETECKKMSGSREEGYGIIFGASNKDNYEFYLLAINTIGKYVVWKHTQKDGYKLIKDWAISEKINTGFNAANTLKAIKDKTTFTVFINGSQVFQFKDSTIKGDRLAYWVEIGSENNELFPNTPVDIRFRQKNRPELLGKKYIQKKTGFSMFIPKNWNIIENKQTDVIAAGPRENYYIPTIAAIYNKYSGSISALVDGAILEYTSRSQLFQSITDFRVVEKGSFETLQGMQGGFFTIQGKVEDQNVWQKCYFIPNKKGNMAIGIACTSGNKYDSTFDECIKTFFWIK